MRMNDMKAAILSVWKKNKKQMILLCGALLVLVVLTVVDSDNKHSTNGPASDELYVVESALEHRLEDFLKSVNGVGRVKVCVTFATLEKSEYAADVQTETRDDVYKQMQEYLVIDNTEGGETGLLLTRSAPEIRGVAVCCEGGTNAKVRNEVTNLLSAALGISTAHIFVSGYSKNK